MGEASDINRSKHLRKEYLEVQERTREEKNAGKENTKELFSLFHRTNELLERVNTSSELNLDARVSGEVVDISSRKVQRLCQSGSLTVEEFVELVKKKTARGAAEYVSSAFRGETFPPVLQIEEIEYSVEEDRKKRVLIKIDEKEARRPETEENRSLDQIDMPKQIGAIYNVVKKKKKVELLELVLDPEDFSKTVENTLYLSFAVKLERAFISQGGGTLYVTSEREEQADDSHVVLSFTKEEIERLNEKYGSRASLL